MDSNNSTRHDERLLVALRFGHQRRVLLNESDIREGHANVEEIEWIDLRKNYISSLDALLTLNLLALTKLFLGANELAVIPTGLSQATPNLRELVMNNNRLTSTAGVAGLRSLELLDVRSNRISSLCGLHDLVALRRLSVSSNALCSIVLDELPDVFSNLSYVGLHGNGIIDGNEIVALVARSPKLESLSVSCNPFLKNCPMLPRPSSTINTTTSDGVMNAHVSDSGIVNDAVLYPPSDAYGSSSEFNISPNQLTADCFVRRVLNVSHGSLRWIDSIYLAP